MLKQMKRDELILRQHAADHRRMQLMSMKQSGVILEAGHDWIDGEIAQLTADIRRMETQKAQLGGWTRAKRMVRRSKNTMYFIITGYRVPNNA
jgi:hypothetical protein